MNGFSKKYNALLFLLIVIIIGYWQVSFLVSSLKWDLIDVVFPFRFHFSECIQSGYFPFWNPYLQTGTPFFADLQTPIFYPELLIISLGSGYGIYTMHFLFVSYLLIGGYGMYRLSYQKNRNQVASTMAGMVYALSGYIIGHGQHFFLLVGTAWIPFVLASYLRLIHERTFIQVLKTSVFVFLMVTGAYQALSITMFYLLAFIFLGTTIELLKEKKSKEFLQFFKLNVYMLLIVVVLLLPLIVSTLDVILSVDRLQNGISLKQTITSGQSLRGILSFLLPLSTLQYDAFWGNVDISMRNHYIGLLPLVLFVLALLQKRSKTEYLLLFFGMIIFASSFRILHVREFLFRFIPMMNLFKYAAYIRIFGLLAFILLASNYLAYLMDNFDKEKNKLISAVSILMLIFLLLLFYSLKKIDFEAFKQLKTDDGFYGILKNMDFYQRVLVQSLFQILILSGFLLIIIFKQRLSSPFVLLLLLGATDMLVSAQLNMDATVISHEYKPYRMKRDLALYPSGFPVPVDSKISTYKNTLSPPFWRNTSNFTKQVSFAAFSSFELNSFSKLDDNYQNLKNSVINHHLFYFSDTILSLNIFSDGSINQENKSNILYFNKKEYALLSQMRVKTDTLDFVHILEFSPNKVVVETTTKDEQFLTTLQTNFPGWKAFIDDTPANIYTSNFNYRTILLPAGKHRVSYMYKNNRVLVLFIISNLFFFFILLFLIGRTLKKRGKSKWFIITVLSLIILVPTILLVKRLTSKNLKRTVHEEIKDRWVNKEVLFHFDENFEENTSNIIKGQKCLHVTTDNKYVNFVSISNKEYNLHSATMVVRVLVSPQDYSEAFIVSDVKGDNTENRWHALPIDQQIEQPGRWNEILYERNFYDLETTDEISIYLWNRSGYDFLIDDISVDIYPLIQP